MIRNWKRRWFELRERLPTEQLGVAGCTHVLAYYLNEDDITKGAPPKVMQAMCPTYK